MIRFKTPKTPSIEAKIRQDTIADPRMNHATAFRAARLDRHSQLACEFQVYEPLLSEKYDLTALCHASGFGAIHYVRPVDERGRSNAERLLAALKQSAQVGYENYSSVLFENEKLRSDSSHPSPPSPLRRAIQKVKRIWPRQVP